MSILSGLKQQSGGGRGSNAPTENVVFQVKSYHMVDPKKPSDGDYIEVVLGHDVQGGKAKQGDVVKLRYNAGNDGNARRPSILEYQRGRGNSKAMAEGALGIANRAYIDEKTGDMICNWLERWYPDVNPDGKNLHFPLPNIMASVRPEFPYERDGETKYGQNRFVVQPVDAKTFSGFEGLKSVGAAIIDGLAGTPGKHGVIVRMAEIDADVQVSAEIWQTWDGEAGANRNGLDTISYWIENNPVAKQWADAIEAKDASVVYEVIPTLRFGTGSMSLPSMQIADRERDGKPVSDADRIRFDDSQRYRVAGADGDRDDYGYALSHVKVVRVADEDDAVWFSTGTIPASTRPLMFLREEILTPNLPAQVAERLVAKAEGRQADRRSNNRPAADAPAAEENEAPAPRGM